MMVPRIVTLVVMAVGAMAAAAPSQRGRKCGSPGNNEIAVLNRNASAIEAANAAAGLVESAATLVVDTYFHVVAVGKEVSDGYISQESMTKQFAAMNKAFEPYGIQFNLKGTDWTINKNWGVDLKTKKMKKTLRKGDYKTLNIYFQKRLMDDNLGYCYFPIDAPTPGTNKFNRDGCSIDSASVPGGSYTDYNMGLTTVHEIGHWFGLLHTFEGQNCSGDGDLVDDTPQQLSATTGCPEGRDSCPKNAGLDPIHNYMDYSYDTCYTQFSEGQRKRMRTMYNTYRNNS